MNSIGQEPKAILKALANQEPHEHGKESPCQGICPYRFIRDIFLKSESPIEHILSIIRCASTSALNARQQYLVTAELSAAVSCYLAVLRVRHRRGNLDYCWTPQLKLQVQEMLKHMPDTDQDSLRARLDTFCAAYGQELLQEITSKPNSALFLYHIINILGFQLRASQDNIFDAVDSILANLIQMRLFKDCGNFLVSNGLETQVKLDQLFKESIRLTSIIPIDGLLLTSLSIRNQFYSFVEGLEEGASLDFALNLATQFFQRHDCHIKSRVYRSTVAAEFAALRWTFLNGQSKTAFKRDEYTPEDEEDIIDCFVDCCIHQYSTSSRISRKLFLANFNINAGVTQKDRFMNAVSKAFFTSEARRINKLQILEPPSTPISASPNVQQYYRTNAPIHLVDTQEAFASCIRVCMKALIIAFDAEFVSTPNGSPICLFQLSIRYNKKHQGDVFLLDMLALDCKAISKDMMSLLVNPGIVWIGFSCHDDIAKLVTALMANPSGDSEKTTRMKRQEIAKKMNLIDLSKSKIFQTSEKKSLKALTEIVFEGRVTLDKRVQITRWDHRPLRQCQMLYAANDADVLIHAYNYEYDSE